MICEKSSFSSPRVCRCKGTALDFDSFVDGRVSINKSVDPFP